MSGLQVTVNCHHGGKFELVNGELQYVNGTLTKFKKFDPDFLSLYQIEDAVRSLGYESGIERLWYKLPSEAVADRKPLWADVDNSIRRMVEAAKWMKEVDVFVEHGSGRATKPAPPCLLDFSANVVVGGDEGETYADSYEDEEFEGEFESYASSSDDLESDGHWSDAGANNVVTDEEEKAYSMDELSDGFDDEIAGDFVDVHIEDEASNNNALVDDEESIVPDVSIEEANCDERFPYTPPDTDEEWDNFDRQMPPKQQPKNVKCSDCHLSVFQEFGSGKEFKDRIIKYSLSTGYDIKMKRSSNTTKEAVCSDSNCGWRVYGSLNTNSQRWSIKTYTENHRCQKSGRSKILKIPVIANLFLERIRRKPSLKATEIRDEIKREYNLDVTLNMCTKARKKAVVRVQGDYGTQFEKLFDYAYEMTRSNPGTTVEVETDANMEFSRMYICFMALKTAWKRFCRPVIGLDGCFLKWTLKGQLLAAVGRDANNRMYPVAWAVVPVENTQHWAWFINKLRDDLDLKDGDGFTILSDKQKGLVKVLEHELPKVEHRMCARHVYANLKKKHKEKKLKPLFWKAARSYSTNAYQDALLDIRTLSEEAHRSILGSQPHTWCRAFFKPTSCCADEHNNLSECFNSTIKDARTKPIIHMLEDIRRQCMERIFKRHKASLREHNLFTPFAQNHLEQARKDAINCVMFRSSEGYFEIDDCGESFTVSLSSRTCACREWDLTGLPCRHAICAINGNKLDVSKYVSHYYLTRTWQGLYTHTMNAVNGEKLWQKLQMPPVKAPPSRKMPGRPKKGSRIIDPNESPSKYGKSTRHGRVMRCSVCGKVGHNKATCTKKPQTENPTSEVPQRKRGRPKKCNPNEGTSTPDAGVGSSVKSKVKAGRKKRYEKVPQGYGLYTNVKTNQQFFRAGKRKITKVTPTRPSS